MIKKSKKIWPLMSLGLISSPLIIFTSISCSNSNNNSSDDNSSSSINALQKLINENQISIDPKINIPLEIFNQYKNNFNDLTNVFKIVNNSEDKSLNLTFSIVSANLNSNQKQVDYVFQINDLNSNQSAILEKSINLEPSLSQYYDSVYDFAQDNIELKSEYKNKRVIELLEQTSSNEDFINKYINLNQLNQNTLGVSFELQIPSQVLNMDEDDSLNSHYFKLKLIMKDKEGKEITPSLTAKSPYLRLEQEQKDTFTIINDIDLSNPVIGSLGSSSYYGKTFIRKNNNSSDELIIRTNLSNKTIVGDLDFSKYIKITFEDSCFFSNNLIENVLFKTNATIIGLQNSKFVSNKIKSINLPKTVKDFNLNCFDSIVKIKGLENIQNIDKIINSANDLDLSTLSSSQINNYFSILDRWNKSKGLSISFKNVIVPVDYIKSSQTPSVVLSCEKLIINNPNNINVIEWNANFSSWIIEAIEIPSYVIKIDKSKLPSNSNITRELNTEIKSLIKTSTSIPEKHLEINSDKFPITNENIANAYSNFDKYFYTFNSSNPLDIKAIVFSINSYPSSTQLSNYLKFLTQLSGPIKFIIKNDKISPSDYNNLKSFVDKEKSKYSIVRNSSKKSQIINNRKLLLNKLNEINDSDLYQYLVGLENEFDTIDTSLISEIKKNTFYNLSGNNWETKTINLTSNIVKISDGAFNSSSIQITYEDNFNPTEVGASAFASSNLSGQLNWTNLTTVGIKSFYSTKITSVTFNDQITNLANGVFYGCSSLTNVNLPNLVSIGSEAFRNCTSLVLLNLPNLVEINDNAFYNCSKLTGFNDLSSITKLGNSAFYGCKSLTGEISLNENVNLGTNVFSNCSTNISFKNFNKQNNSVTSLLGTSSSNYNSIDLNINEDQLFKKINYNNGILDLSQMGPDWTTNIENMNYLYYFKSLKKPINKLVLPSLSYIDKKISECFKGVLINELVWNYEGSKDLTTNINYLFGANVKSLNEDFFKNISVIPQSVMSSLNIINATFNLEGVREVKNNAFNNLVNAKFKNTTEIKIIGSKSFKNDCTFEIGTNVKLEEDSFTSSILNSSTITRKTIFYNDRTSKISSYMKIYNQETKILDFTKIAKNENISLYSGIGDYLMSGDVKKIILPNEYKLTANLLNNLGDVGEIVFSNKNQIIESNAFYGTKILNKPSQDQTRIILDLDNFFI